MSWPSLTIEEMTEVVTKGTTPTTIGRDFTDQGVQFIKAEALNGDTYLESGGIAFIDEETHQSLRRSMLEEDDVLITIAGAQIGKCGYVTQANLPANTNQAVGIVRIDRTKAVPRFVYYFFKQPRTFQAIQSIGSGQAAQPNLNLGNLKQITLPLPPIDVQRAIASLLRTYDDLIENNRRRMALLEESARLLYREWFVRLRFPGYEHTPIVDGVPQGWERRTAFDSMHVLSGGTPKTTMPDYWDGETPFFTPKDATDGIWVSACERSVTELGIKNCNSKLYPRETVFITARGTVGKLNMAQVPMAMSQSCYALVGKDHLSQRFVYSAMEAGVDALRQQAVGAVFDAIVVDTFKRIKLMVPPVPMLRLFDEAVTPVFDQVENLALQNQKLRAARDLLLPRLMSGEIAV